jgi:hypothetical protein
VNEDLSELARRNNEFRNEINSVIAIPAKLGWRRLIWTELAVELKILILICLMSRVRSGECDCSYLCQIKTCTVAAVVIIPVHVKDLFAFDGQQSRQNTFCQTGTEDNDLPIVSVYF